MLANRARHVSKSDLRFFLEKTRAATAKAPLADFLKKSRLLALGLGFSTPGTLSAFWPLFRLTLFFCRFIAFGSLQLENPDGALGEALMSGVGLAEIQRSEPLQLCPLRLICSNHVSLKTSCAGGWPAGTRS